MNEIQIDDADAERDFIDRVRRAERIMILRLVAAAAIGFAVGALFGYASASTPASMANDSQILNNFDEVSK